jgi:salicylate hydroxylase
MHRADLQAVLLAVARDTPGIELRLGAPFDTVGIDSDGVRVTSGPGDHRREDTATALIGADGVWSSIRGLDGSAKSKFTGELAWRATISAESEAGAAFAEIAQPDCVTTFLHPGFHLVAYPMRGGAAFNLVAFTKGERIAEGWSGKADAAILSSSMHGTAPALTRLATGAGPWTAWPVHTVDPHHAWTSPDGTALIGDAAHAMSPFAAQGAAMAIEDAATLAASVAEAPDNLPEALASWEKTRKVRIARVARRGALNHLAWHAAGPVALARNLVLKMRSPETLAADLDWLYGWRPPKETTGRLW